MASIQLPADQDPKYQAIASVSAVSPLLAPRHDPFSRLPFGKCYRRASLGKQDRLASGLQADSHVIPQVSTWLA